MTRNLSCLSAALLFAATAISAQGPAPPAKEDSVDQIRSTIKDLAAKQSVRVTVELRPAAVPLVFGEFDDRQPPPMGVPLQRIQGLEGIMVGHVVRADDRGFTFKRGHAVEMQLYYEDVKKVTLPQVQFSTPRRREHAVETVLLVPVRVLHILLGGLCEPF